MSSYVHSKLLLALMLASFLQGRLNAASSQADWPMYRGGPALTGIASGSLPDKPVLLWTFKTDGPVNSSAALIGDRAYIGSGDGQVYALDLKTGKKIWSHKTEGDIESSPLVMDGRLYIGSNDGFLYALDASDGRQIWKFETEDKIPGSPNWVRSADGKKTSILVGSYDFRLYSLDAATGQSNWVYESGNYINGSPAAAGGVTAFGGCDALLHVISLQDGKQVKEIEAGAYIIGSVAIDQERAYVGHYGNEFVCIDLKESKPVWRYRDRNFPYSSSPALASDRVVFGGDDKRVHCVRREDGEPIWVYATRGKVESSPVICGGKVVVGSNDGRLYIISLKDGKELWHYEIGDSLRGSPAVARGMIVVGADDGNVYAFGDPASNKLSQR